MGSTPSAPSPPPAPNYAQANVSGVSADLGTLEARNKVEALRSLGQSGTYDIPQFDDKGNIVGYQTRNVDFSGLGDAAKAQAEQDSQLNLARSAAPELLALNQQYGTQFVDENRKQQEAADPEAFKSRQVLGQQVLDDLALGDQLSDSQRRNVEQSTRLAQTARGNALGANPSIDEALASLDYGNQLKQQRSQNAQAFVFGQPLASYNTSAAQQGATPYSPIGYGAQGIGVNAAAGAQGAQFASSIYGTQAGIYGQQLASAGSKSNPWMTGLGTLGGIGATLGAAALAAPTGGASLAAPIALGAAGGFCWVAREVYGAEDPSWLLFRDWMLTESPEWLFSLYANYGEAFAKTVKANQWMKKILKPLMNRVI